MKAYRLKFATKKEAETVLISEEVIDKELNFLEGTFAVVWIGAIVLIQAEINEQMEITKEAVLAEGFHVDLLLEDETKTFVNEIFPNSPNHSFAGIIEFIEEIIE